ncbi:SDR family NAD(P)-dependent oxidoreductase [Salipiger abyssi]|uniref:Short-chain alcohol dehydrogenase n=1 Tax=Salipiger abyssi TaxID=1250539 RepID=A0A1P8UX33_9RHOB|nr:SDR family NAD(P)-dependent oxidoreductase [Salipiger abyssi]APZ53950.1 short-chain alcohol dehydrogenase [Salipiger abyssi]
MTGAPVAMITGASRGIGAAIAEALAARGYRLALGLRDPATLTETLAPHDPLVVRYDATEPADAKRFTEATETHFGRIDALVNSAGISGPLELMPDPPQPDDEMEEMLDALLSVNVKAPFRLTRAALPALCRSGAGRVIVLASLSGKRVLGLNAGYQMSKHAAVALSHAARRAGWDQGLRACAVCPSFVATDMTLRHDHLPRHEITQPEDLARLVADVVTLPNSASVSELLVNWRYEPGM